MKLLTLMVTLAFAEATPLHNGYLPPSSDVAVLAQTKSQSDILRYDNIQDDQGFHYGYESSDGTTAEQQGRLEPASEDSNTLKVSGSYSFVGSDGRTYTVTYTADENGFRAEGDHLPTPPPIPEEIAKALKLIAEQPLQDDNAVLYNSGVDSYEAGSPAGYFY